VVTKAPRRACMYWSFRPYSRCVDVFLPIGSIQRSRLIWLQWLHALSDCSQSRSQINISSLSVSISVFVIHHQELLPHNVEPEYDTTVRSYGWANTGVDQHIGKKNNHISENDTTFSSKVLRLKHMTFFFLPLICYLTSTVLSNFWI
jgi:hypothetical protein